ncbi:hypothetical protein BKA59DRAFT_483579 [Fusarium tricinctum]|uniref:Uncharacterized protein n=1 Tax=Fusarium tricinctum TaxID=61284 RepID=A0A8K0RUV9_9HYPO|nr:hypothetical protein BKA59DRAFT_483579 [Fusarium tricinctum]
MPAWQKIVILQRTLSRPFFALTIALPLRDGHTRRTHSPNILSISGSPSDKRFPVETTRTGDRERNAFRGSRHPRANPA